MPDKRQHRGPHPHDAELFCRRHWPALQSATADLCWLLSRGYSQIAAVKLVGDRFALRHRQRLAVQRSSCSDAQLADRLGKQVDCLSMVNKSLLIDGFNLLTTIEAALANGVIIFGQDGCCRDMASVHGTYRIVQETLPALSWIGEYLVYRKIASARWLLDAPVSNSGRLAAEIRQLSILHKWPWEVELVRNPDDVLRSTGELVISADSVVLDDCHQWINLATQMLLSRPEQTTIIPMSQIAASRIAFTDH